MRTYLTRIAAVAGALFAVPVANAETLTADFAGVSPSQTVSVTYNNVAYNGVSAGFFNWINVSPATSAFAPSFQSFCAEINVGVLPTTTFTTTPLSPRYSSSQASRLREFWGENFASAGASATNAAAFQIGVWEIVGENGATSLDLASGNFKADSSPNSNAAIDQAKAWLANVDGQGTFEDNLTLLDSESSQDQIGKTTPSTVVPVPPAVVLGGMGLMSLMGYGVRRRLARKAAKAPQAEAKG